LKSSDGAAELCRTVFFSVIVTDIAAGRVRSMLTRFGRRAMLAGALSCAAHSATAQLIRGSVADAAARAPLPNAVISIIGVAAQPRTDDSGHFSLALPRPGTVILTVRRVGYIAATWTFALAATDTADLKLELQPAAQMLDTVNVDAAAAVAARLEGFERRRQQKNGGYYVTRADIDKDPPTQTADILRRAPGVEVRQKGLQTVVVSRRGPVSVLLTPDMCVMPLGRDGLILGPSYNLNDIPASEIYGIEVYNGPATIPAEFRNSLPNGVCGLIMVWTRSGGTR
jgi:hypothetical protein